MTDTNITIKGKRGCSDTGITEELATKIYSAAREGKANELVAIVRFVPEITHQAVNGSVRSVDLAITAVEPVIDGDLNGALDEHVRTIEQALFRNRKLAEGRDDTLPFGEEDGPAPKVADIIQQGQPFVVDEDDLEDDEEQSDDESEDDATAEEEDVDHAGEPEPASTVRDPFTVVPG